MNVSTSFQAEDPRNLAPRGAHNGLDGSQGGVKAKKRPKV